MTSNNSSQNGSLHAIIVVVLVLVLFSTLGFVYWNNFAQKNPTLNDSARPDIEDVLTLDGTVTLIYKSCGAESLYPEEKMSRYAICDSGNGIRIDDKVISTSSGGPGRGFHVDIDSIRLGDTVSARYIVDENYGGASLDCKKCSIVVTKTSNEEN